MFEPADEIPREGTRDQPIQGRVRFASYNSSRTLVFREHVLVYLFTGNPASFLMSYCTSIQPTFALGNFSSERSEI
jgi:hypothetical protein